jgi:Zn-dependent peptidase ImmA (M78 family)
MKRGFKAEAERISAELRTELHLTAHGRLDPMKLAEHLEIPILGLNQVSRATPSNSFQSHFCVTEPDAFSAVTVFQGYKRTIIHNDSHHPNRQASNISHEISHSLLEHEPAPIADENGERYWNAEFEQEANWLGAALLVPREAALEMLRSGWTVCEIASHFGVSEALSNWRITQTGILQQIQRSRRN